jgi:carbohydrate kinase (thermoresistant glucokinase family)
MKRMIVIMSVAGCGKTTVGERLADATGFAFVDGDRLHPRANIEKMSMGQPLIDEDRWPWLAAVGKTLAQSDRSIIIVYSALRRAYRDRIRAHAGGPAMRLPSLMPLTALRAVIHRMLTAAGLGSEDQAALMEFFKGPDKEQFR